MKKALNSILAFALALLLVIPMSATALADNDESEYDNYDVAEIEVAEEPVGVGDRLPDRPGRELPDPIHKLGEDGRFYFKLRPFVESFGSDIQLLWDGALGAVNIITGSGITHRIVVEEVGGFVQNGITWLPIEMYPIVRGAVFQPMVHAWTDDWGFWSWPIDDEVERIDLTLWEAERFADTRDQRYLTDLPIGEIAVNYIRYINDNLPGRSAFTYRELETAVWIVEELLSMGHSWDSITVQEFTYWDVRGLNLDFWGGGLDWWLVTHPMVLGVDREHLLREDRVSQNVILTIPGQSNRKIIVGAHYDSPPYPSASDNASGTALLLESAQRILELDNYYTIVYIWFGAEEVGLIGAQYYYERLTAAQRDNIVMMVNADVIIEGPYIIYGAGAQPTVEPGDINALRIDVIEHFVSGTYDHVVENFEQMIQYGWIRADASLESVIVEWVVSDIGWILRIDDSFLVEFALSMGLLDAVADEISAAVSALAAALNEEYNLGIISIPQAVFAPSDHRVFLNAGHRVVNFIGVERVENIDEFGHLVYRWEILFDEFMLTVLHGPHDDFHVIESYWPGMMNANLRTFGMLLERIVTIRFD